jgi:hypothetical protein
MRKKNKKENTCKECYKRMRRIRSSKEWRKRKKNLRILELKKSTQECWISKNKTDIMSLRKGKKELNSSRIRWLVLLLGRWMRNRLKKMKI